MAECMNISIIGPGRVGTAIGVLAARAGLNVAAVGGGRRMSAQIAARVIGPAVRCLSAAEAAAAGDLVLLTVPDDAIAPLCAELAQAGAFGAGTVVAHCCGALSSQALLPAQEKGAQTGSIHPLQTFATVDSAVVALPGTFCFIEGTPQACQSLETLAAAIGARSIKADPQRKPLYHAAAVMVSNYLVTLLDAAGAMMASSLSESSGINRQGALTALEPLIQSVLQNTIQLGAEQALTGPIARGDLGTVQMHLAQIDRDMPEMNTLYRELGRRTVDLALRKGTIDETRAQQLKQLLA